MCSFKLHGSWYFVTVTSGFWGEGVKVILVISNGQQPFIVLAILTLSEPRVRSSRKQKRLSNIHRFTTCLLVCVQEQEGKKASSTQSKRGWETDSPAEAKENRDYKCNQNRFVQCSPV